MKFMRQCPTPNGAGGRRPLITHQITGCQCVERQEQHYHKCHSCLFQGRSVEFTLPDTNGVEQNGDVRPQGPRDDQGAQLRTEHVVEIPARNGDAKRPETNAGETADKADRDASPVASSLTRPAP